MVLYLHDRGFIRCFRWHAICQMLSKVTRYFFAIKFYQFYIGFCGKHNMMSDKSDIDGEISLCFIVI